MADPLLEGIGSLFAQRDDLPGVLDQCDISITCVESSSESLIELQVNARSQGGRSADTVLVPV